MKNVRFAQITDWAVKWISEIKALIIIQLKYLIITYHIFKTPQKLLISFIKRILSQNSIVLNGFKNIGL